MLSVHGCISGGGVWLDGASRYIFTVSQASAKGGVFSIRRREKGPYNTLQSEDVGGTGWWERIP